MASSSYERFPGGWSWPDERRTADEHQSFFERTGAEKRDSREDHNETNQPHNQAQSEGTRTEQGKRRAHWRPRTCRICLETVNPTFQQPTDNIPEFLHPKPRVVYESEDGPLISPCKCKGSSRYVHESCLQAWRNADPTNKRNFWQCPTCGFKYRLSRLAWGSVIAGTTAQLSLTAFVLLAVIFVFGFIADPIISLYYDPFSTLTSTITGEASEFDYLTDDHGSGSWMEHFIKGFASLGLLSFLKIFLASPLSWFRSSGIASGSGRAGSGRARLANVSWFVVMIGVFMFLWSVYKFVRLWSTRFLSSAGQKVMDVQTDDDDENDESSGPDRPAT